MKAQHMSWIISFGLIILIIFLISCRNKKKDKGDSELSYGFSKIKDSIWYNNELQKDIDAASFEIIDEYFCKDKNQVFHHRSYRESRDYFITKKRLIHKLTSADPATFMSLDYGYARDKNSAWYQENSINVSDVQSLTALDFQFLKDKNNVYLQNKIIKGVKGESFERINTSYAKDDQRYYYIYTDQINYELIPIDCNYTSFELLDFNYSKDNSKIFYDGKVIDGASTSSFEIVSPPYTKDNQRVYFRNKVLAEADPHTFSMFEENGSSLGNTYYSKDKSHIFVNDRIFEGVDAKSFKILNEKYCTDKNGVYFQMKKIKNADALSFTVYPHYMGEADAEDKNHKYGDGRIVE